MLRYSCLWMLGCLFIVGVGCDGGCGQDGGSEKTPKAGGAASPSSSVAKSVVADDAAGEKDGDRGVDSGARTLKGEAGEVLDCLETTARQLNRWDGQVRRHSQVGHEFLGGAHFLTRTCQLDRSAVSELKAADVTLPTQLDLRSEPVQSAGLGELIDAGILDGVERIILGDASDIEPSVVEKLARLDDLRRLAVTNLSEKAQKRLAEVGTSNIEVFRIGGVLTAEFLGRAEQGLFRGLETLKLQMAKLHASGADVLANLKYPGTIRTLDVRLVNFGADGESWAWDDDEHETIGRRFFRQLFANESLKGLRALRVAHALTQSEVKALADSPMTSSLRTLVLDGRDFGSPMLSELVTGGFSNLEVLHLSGHDAELGLLSEADWLSNLRELDVRLNDVGGEDIRGVAASLEDGRLRRLDVENCDVTSEAVEVISTDPAFSELEELNLESNSLAGDQLGGLFSTKNLSGLRRLNLNHNELGLGLARALRNAEHRRNLTALHLGGNKDVGDKVVRAMASNESFAGLRLLDLGNTGLTNSGVMLLANKSVFEGMCALNLTGAHKVEQVKPLAGSSNMSSLEWLGLPWVSSEAIEPIIHASWLDNLRYLRLNQTPLVPEQFEGLAARDLPDLEYLNMMFTFKEVIPNGPSSEAMPVVDEFMRDMLRKPSLRVLFASWQDRLPPRPDVRGAQVFIEPGEPHAFSDPLEEITCPQ